MKRLRTLKSFQIFESEMKKSKTYIGWSFQGLSNGTTLMQIQSGRTVPLTCHLKMKNPPTRPTRKITMWRRNLIQRLQSENGLFFIEDMNITVYSANYYRHYYMHLIVSYNFKKLLHCRIYSGSFIAKFIQLNTVKINAQTLHTKERNKKPIAIFPKTNQITVILKQGSS